MMLGKTPFFGADIQKLGEIAAAGDFATRAAGGGRATPMLDRYVDAARCATIEPGRALTRRLGCRQRRGRRGDGAAVAALAGRAHRC